MVESVPLMWAVRHSVSPSPQSKVLPLVLHLLSFPPLGVKALPIITRSAWKTIMTPAAAVESGRRLPSAWRC
jgi:hypothetical protein